jgi:[acyl-carrier-protein] S-malonyltransferase
MSLAFVFPGQGSQAVGMLSGLAESNPLVNETFTEANEALGFDLWTLVQNGPEESLNQTTNTQPAMLAAGVAAWRVWRDMAGATPTVMAGHSLGEYTALVCAGGLGFADAVKLVADRGRFMQEAVPAGEGAMAAIIGLDDDGVRSLCEQNASGDVLSPVNFNSPGQVVIAGSTAAVQRAVDGAKSAGAKRALVLPVSVPSHCQLMHGAAERMAERLASIEIQVPEIPVIHNFNVRVEQSPEAIKTALVSQVEQPVRWVETIQKMSADGVDKLVECGPGKVLVGLNKRIDKAMETWAVYDAETMAAALEGVK